jgi:amino acid adenylation domain-containing protein
VAGALSQPSIGEILRRRAEREPDRTGYVFLGETGEGPDAALSYGALDARAAAIAAALRERGAARRPVVLAHPAGLDFVAAFFGCLYAGAVPVALQPPATGLGSGMPVDGFLALAGEVGPAAVLGPGAVLGRVPGPARGGDALRGCAWLAQEEAEAAAGDGLVAAPDPRDLAYLQYTSGSTSRPRGVMVSHGAAIDQLERYRTRAGAEGDDGAVMVSWLPHQHDFGLVGFVLAALHMGLPYHFMPPRAFLRRPRVWLEAMSRLGGTYSGAPTFAYDLCAGDPRVDPAALDLSRWSIASVGAEPIAAAALERFARRFEPSGFTRAAFLTTYGLAEAVLCVTGRRGVATSGSRARPRVSTGSPLRGQTVLIVDPEARTERAEGEAGEIWLAGASLASGYWRRPEETERAFCGVLADTGAGPFLRTGDLGYLRDGELFVVDRLKDLIVVRGRNHHPHDLELTAQAADPALREGCGAAFQDGEPGEERLVVVQELEREAEPRAAELAEAVRAAVAEEHGLRVDAVELIKARSLPRSASGKVSRRAARAAWRAGELRTLARTGTEQVKGDRAPEGAAEPDPVAAEIALAFAEALGLARVDPDADFLELGGDSLDAQQVVGTVADRLEVELPVRALFEERTPARVAAVAADLERASGSSAPASDPGGMPLTPSQRDVVQLAALGPDASPAFHVMSVLELSAEPDEPALRRALAGLVERHESLRTVLDPDASATRVLPEVDLPLELAGVREDGVVEWLRAERARPFDLSARPPWRVALLRGGRAPRLVLTAHHLIADGASARPLVADLAALYAAERDGDARPLAPPMQHSDYRRARERRATPEAMERHRRHWLEELGPELTVLELPTDRPRPRVPEFAGENHTDLIPAATREAVARLAREHGCTPFMVLVAAWSALLHRLTAQDDVLLAFASDGRDLPGSHELVGGCSTDLPLRVQAPADATVAELLARVREKVLGALEHRDYTLSMLLDHQRAPVDARRPTRITTAFNLETLPAPGPDLAADLELQVRSITRCLLDLEANAVDTGDGIRIDYTYNTAVLDEAAVRRIASYYRRLVEGMTADPARAVLEVPLLPPEEERLLEDWGVGPEGDPGTDRVPELVDTRAEATPGAVAVAGDDGSLTYAELRERSDSVAAAVRAGGAGPGDVVAVLAPRGPGFVAALLGVLKAGAAFLPLDPRDPDRRVAATLERSGARMAIVGPGVEPPERAPVLALEAALRHPAGRPGGAAAPAGGPRDPAYVIYTSGSTGAPKGATVAHGGLVNHLRAKIASLGLSADDVVAQTAPQSFDIVVWQALAPLVAGAAVRVLADEETHDPVRLLSAVERERITVFETVPSMLRQLLDDDVMRAAGRPRLRALRWLIPTGEALPPELCRRWMRIHPSVPMLNAYGPAECSDDVAQHRIEWPPPAGAVRVPIGRPIQGARAYVLDPRGALAPIGAPGELYVGGVCVGLGYLNDPERTAQSFVPDPFGGPGPGTLYRTGDSVRWRGDGTLEFLGRIDDQEQVQGARVEPGEVEAVLGQHPAVRECAVTVRRAADGTGALAAYVALRDGSGPAPAELRLFLRDRLAHYMVPATIDVLGEIPLSANGKVDRRALPEPRLNGHAQPGRRVAPRTETERALAAIWAGTLAREDLSVHDDFFDLGGRSLDAVALATELREAFEVEFPVFQVYREPSLAGMARLVEAAPRREEPQWT